MGAACCNKLVDIFGGAGQEREPSWSIKRQRPPAATTGYRDMQGLEMHLAPHDQVGHSNTGSSAPSHWTSALPPRIRELKRTASAALDVNNILDSSGSLPPCPAIAAGSSSGLERRSTDTVSDTGERRRMTFAKTSAITGLASPYENDATDNIVFLVPGNEMLFVGGASLNGAVGRLLLREAGQPIAFEYTEQADDAVDFELDEFGELVMGAGAMGATPTEKFDSLHVSTPTSQFKRKECVYATLHENLFDQAYRQPHKLVVASEEDIGVAPVMFAGARVFSDSDSPFGAVFLDLFKEDKRPFGCPGNVGLVYAVAPIGKPTRSMTEKSFASKSTNTFSSRPVDVRSNPQDFVHDLFWIGSSCIQAIVEFNQEHSRRGKTKPPVISIVRVPMVSADPSKLHPRVTPTEAALALIWGVSQALNSCPAWACPKVQLMPDMAMKNAYQMYFEDAAVPSDWNTEETNFLFEKIKEAPVAADGSDADGCRRVRSSLFDPATRASRDTSRVTFNEVVSFNSPMTPICSEAMSSTNSSGFVAPVGAFGIPAAPLAASPGTPAPDLSAATTAAQNGTERPSIEFVTAEASPHHSECSEIWDCTPMSGATSFLAAQEALADASQEAASQDTLRKVTFAEQIDTSELGDASSFVGSRGFAERAHTNASSCVSEVWTGDAASGRSSYAEQRGWDSFESPDEVKDKQQKLLELAAAKLAIDVNEASQYEDVSSRGRSSTLASSMRSRSSTQASDMSEIWDGGGISGASSFCGEDPGNFAAPPPSMCHSLSIPSDKQGVNAAASED